MKAYITLCGGGVKGPAMAGCIDAARKQGIEPIGFGGTSVGSVVATLAAVGYGEQDDELRGVIVDTEFTSLLDDNGARLQTVKAQLAKLVAVGKLNGLSACLALNRIHKTLQTDLGLYKGDKLKEELRKHIVARIPGLADGKLSMNAINRETGKLLRIVSSNVVNRSAHVFTESDETSVLEAIRSSISYPFVFRPVRLVDDAAVYLDGGLASNSPSFVFAEEHKRSRHPVFAFDLVLDPAARSLTYSLADMLKDIVGTALDASDTLIRNLAPGVEYVPVRLKTDVQSMDFGINRNQREQLYGAGFVEASNQLHKNRLVQLSRESGPEIINQLLITRAAPRYVAPILEGLARKVEEITNAAKVRTHIMLPTGRGTKIVVYSAGMDGDTDIDLELGEQAGCSGTAMLTKEATAADLTESANKPQEWGMSEEQHRKVPAERCAMISMPIFGSYDASGNPDGEVIGVLSADTVTPLDGSGWQLDNGVTDRILELLRIRAYILSRFV